MNTRSPYDRYTAVLTHEPSQVRQRLFFIDRDGQVIAIMGSSEWECISSIKTAFCDHSELELLTARRAEEFWRLRGLAL